MDLDRDGIRQIERIGRLALDQLGEHGDVREQRADITEDHACLLRIGGYDEDGSALTRSQVAAIVEEAREVNGAERKDEALASAAPTHEPGLGCRLRRRHIAAGALFENGKLVVCHFQSEQRSEECTPSGPRRQLAKPRRKEIRVIDYVEDGDARTHSAASIAATLLSR